MGKHYKYEFKLKVVQEYLNSSLGYRALAKKYEISTKSLIERWVAQYKEFGPEGLSKRLKNKVYTREFKLSVLRFRQENMLSYRETASHFKISNIAMICAWQRRFEENGILGLDSNKKGRPSKMDKKHSKAKTKSTELKESEREELERLRNENEMLKAGIAYQKKLQALTQHYETKHSRK
ncbi:transposase [Staphylococcus xylosus]|uniref:transposase n=1 Tax=Staphylococcus xylosus TaxID=1288 RepID=UPI001F2855B2|nr:transposase [Staphylococcus xylosus]MCE7781960.1 transposase [Staphylococcus xylosus]MCE7782571.1 transposase [Staphylococcus xylosus]MCE7782654.1 transposase [Staphylococcus xylosus]MCE7782669.1 transposase [Staphylococcus xylosus]MCE7783523.1 transposase [Staphylococcus xylosus]